MSGTSIRIEVSDAEIAAGLQRLVDTGADLRPAFEAIGGALLFSTQNRFQSQSGPDGRVWAPFAKSTRERMPESRKPGALLRDRGRLYQSLTFLAEDGAVEVGTNVVYAAIHQFGGPIKRPERQGTAFFDFVSEGAGKAKDGRRVGSKLRFASKRAKSETKFEKAFTVPAFTIQIPARPYLGINEADKAEILAILADHVAEASPAEGTP